jgi:two-component system NarL family sensor kinase
MPHAGICDQYLSQGPACHWVVDSGFRFVAVYGDIAPVFGSVPSAVEGLSFDDALSSDIAATWRERVDRAFQGERLLLRERRSSAIWYIVQYPLTNASGSIEFAGGFALNVTPWSTAEQELRHTVLGALRAQEFERATLSKFLHDSVGQNLSAVGLQLDLLRMDLEATSPEIGPRVAEIQKTLEDMMQEIRDYIYELNPATVERAGLHPALDRLAGRLRNKFPGSLRLIFDPSTKVPSKYATAMYQIALEALENALQHSGCSVIEIAVKSSKMGPVLEIRDNGKGFDPADVAGGGRGLGLLSMEHYAAEAGLDMSITSAREQGTVVRAAAAEGGTV